MKLTWKEWNKGLHLAHNGDMWCAKVVDAGANGFVYSVASRKSANWTYADDFETKGFCQTLDGAKRKAVEYFNLSVLAKELRG